jgi:DNA-binding response OmpR family regulator
VRCIDNATDALPEALAFRPDAMILDLGMPLLSGYELARSVRADSRLDGVKLIALSGWGSPAHREQSRAAGFDQHLTKPAEIHHLDKVIQSFVSR